jgi:molybdopterin synthase catalytic subunit
MGASHRRRSAGSGDPAAGEWRMTMDAVFTHAPISAPPLALPSSEVGAAVEFWGIVREKEGERSLAGLDYEAYESMARSEFARISAELSTQFAIESALVIHRLGWVPVGEASLFVRVCAKHRGAALGFCGALIDRMKEDVPIWKTVR